MNRHDYPIITYFARTAAGVEFNFRSTAVLDMGTPVQNDDGTMGAVYDMVVEFPYTSPEYEKANFGYMCGMSM